MTVWASRPLPLLGGEARFDAITPPVRVGDRMLPREIFVDLHGDDTQPSLMMKIEVRQGVPICAELRLTARPDGPEVRRRDLGAVHIDSWIEQVVKLCEMPFERTEGGFIARWEASPAPSIRNSARRARAGRPRISRERLMRVAELYREHIDSQPVKAVQQAFGVSYRTAAKYVELCRSDSYKLLPKTTQGKKKV